MRLIDADELLSRYPDCRDLKRKVDEMPTVDVVPMKHAHWIPLYPDDIHTIPRCNSCGHWDLNGKRTQYCPKCGAKMED